jgi:ribonuclease P protein component
MPRELRLSREELKVLLSGRLPRLRGVFADVAYGPSLSGPKAACVVAKKTLPRAVDRVRVRRKIKAIITTCLSGVDTGVSLVFFVREGALKADYETLLRDIQDLVKKALISYNTHT